MKTKRCNKCKQDRSFDLFFNASHTHDGKQTICKPCKAANRCGNKTGERVLRDLTSLPGELWKDIEGFEGVYQISNKGRVKSLGRKVIDSRCFTGFREIRPAILKVTYCSSSYPTARLTKGVKSANYPMHQLMWDAWGTEKRDGVKVVDHINNDSDDFRIENLQLITTRLNTTKDRKHPNLLGAVFVKSRNYWAARIRYKGKKIELGYYRSEIKAHERYMRAVADIEKGLHPKPKAKQLF